MLVRNDAAIAGISVGNSHGLQLESLQDSQGQFGAIRELYKFLDLAPPETMPVPTTLGAPWYGNMQSGKVSGIEKPSNVERIPILDRMILAFLLYRTRRARDRRSR
jgi:hypothetical protein